MGRQYGGSELTVTVGSNDTEVTGAALVQEEVRALRVPLLVYF